MNRIIGKEDAEILPVLMRFYGEHFARLDSGEVDGWCHDFTPDAVFSSPNASASGYTELFEKTLAAYNRRIDRGICQRHFQTAWNSRFVDSTILECTSYVLVIETQGSGASEIAFSTVVNDTISSVDGKLLITSRKVYVDGLE